MFASFLCSKPAVYQAHYTRTPMQNAPLAPVRRCCLRSDTRAWLGVLGREREQMSQLRPSPALQLLPKAARTPQ
jgi:hypothetical protein